MPSLEDLIDAKNEAYEALMAATEDGATSTVELLGTAKRYHLASKRVSQRQRAPEAQRESEHGPKTPR